MTDDDLDYWSAYGKRVNAWVKEASSQRKDIRQWAGKWRRDSRAIGGTLVLGNSKGRWEIDIGSTIKESANSRSRGTRDLRWAFPKSRYPWQRDSPSSPHAPDTQPHARRAPRGEDG